MIESKRSVVLVEFMGREFGARFTTRQSEEGMSLTVEIAIFPSVPESRPHFVYGMPKCKVDFDKKMTLLADRQYCLKQDDPEGPVPLGENASQLVNFRPIVDPIAPSAFGGRPAFESQGLYRFPSSRRRMRIPTTPLTPSARRETKAIHTVSQFNQPDGLFGVGSNRIERFFRSGFS